MVYDDSADEAIEELDADESTLLMMRRTCLTPKIEEEFPQHKNLFSYRCTISGKVCTFIIDSGSSENVIAESAVPKLDLVSEPLPSPYKLGWLHHGNKLTVTHRTLVKFSVGDAYKDQVYCDLVPMDPCHLLLGRPWEFDRRVIHDGYLNTYTFKFNGRTFTLKPTVHTIRETPSPPTQALSSPSTQAPVLMLQRALFESTFREEGLVFILITKPTNNDCFHAVPPAFANIVHEFADVFPKIFRPDYRRFVIFNIELTSSLIHLYLTGRITG